MRRTTGLLSGLLLLLAACGDDGNGSTEVGNNAGPITAPENLDDTTPPETAPEAAAIEEQTVPLGTEIHYAGFRAELEESRLILDGGPDDLGGEPELEPSLSEPVVEVDALVENLRAEDESFPVDDIELEWSGGSSPSDFVESDVIRTGATAGITFRFPVDDSFSFDSATLFAGAPSDIQAVVPLNDPDATVPAAPIPLQTPPDSGRDGPIEAKITELGLNASDRWFVVVEQQPLDQPILEVTVDVTRHDDGFYDATVFTDDFRLELPDGTQIAPKSGVTDGIIEARTTMTDAVLTFVLDDTPFDPDGLVGKEFTLLVTGSSVSWDSRPEASVPFELIPQS